MPHSIKSAVVIDDSEIARMSLCAALEAVGWSVVEAGDGAAGLTAVEVADPEVVVCDLHMPDCTGFDVIDALAALDPTLPVVIVSGDSDVHAVLEAVRKGAFDYVIKSDDPGPIQAAVERAARHRRLGRENLQLRLELEDQRDRALEANRTKSAFLANVSHELRTPLNAIIGYSEMVIEELQDVGMPDLAADVQQIKTSGKRLLALIDSVLDLARVEAGHVTLSTAQISIRTLVDEAARIAEPMLAVDGNTLTVAIAPELDLVVVDPQKVHQCVLDLLAHATRACDHGQIALCVDPGEPGFFEISVSDTGAGMTRDQINRVFSLFSRADDSAERSELGLGLVVTRELVVAMGGEISVDSQPGSGSTFTIRLPMDLDRHLRQAVLQSMREAQPH